MKKLITVTLLAFAGIAASAQSITVKDTVMRTYNYSDPDPVAKIDRVYPYLRYQNFAFEAVEQSWKMVVLENDYLRVKIFPQIGGKIWSIYDKRQGKEMFYDNDAVKFREISLRGPWTSGGIEFNYGVIGHAPSTAHPVDFKTETKEDGSVSCYIGVSELLTSSRWMVEINLPKDAVWVNTRSFWHNYSGEYQPYYTWANSGVTATEDMELVYPAAYTIGHNGQITEYPVEDGKDVSKYINQRFGMDKSYHPGGSHKGYFGVYWKSDDFGMLHYALRDEKLGRKYFSWAQSDQGNIWVDILTDTRPQYVELQSGRLFNQNDISCVETPYKQFLFTPFGTDEWNEYWMPFAGIGGVSDMTLRAIVNVTEEEGRTEIGIYPLQKLQGKMTFLDSEDNVMESADAVLKAAEPVNQSYVFASELSSIRFDGKLIWKRSDQLTDRPHKINSQFDLNSAQGLALHANYFFGMREYPRAEEKVDAALALDPSLVQALNLKAMLLYRKMHYEEAYQYANKVLAIDEYNPEANYYGGLIALRLGKETDAMDRFEIAAITTELRSAAYTQLAKIYFRQGEMQTAEDYARKSLKFNSSNVSAYELLYQIDNCPETLETIRGLDPLCHFPDIENALAGVISAEELDASIYEELKLQNYYEAAQFYYEIGLAEKAGKVLSLAKQEDALLCLWKAFVADDPSMIALAESQNIDWVFPYREFSAKVLGWAVENGGGWECRYLLSMLTDSFGDRERAKSLIRGLDAPYAPFYAFRATITGDKADLHKAVEMDPDQWRYRTNLAQLYFNEGNYAKAIELTEKYYSKHPDNFHVGDMYAKALISSGRYEKAEKVLSSIKILPFEGQSGSRVLYRNTKIQLAVKAADSGNYRTALAKVEQARLWPVNLGVGRPYDDLVDERTENFLAAVIYKRMGNAAKAQEYLDVLLKSDPQNDWQSSFDKAVARKDGKYIKLSSIVSEGDIPVDKKLF